MNLKLILRRTCETVRPWVGRLSHSDAPVSPTCHSPHGTMFESADGGGTKTRHLGEPPGDKACDGAGGLHVCHIQRIPEFCLPVVQPTSKILLCGRQNIFCTTTHSPFRSLRANVLRSFFGTSDVTAPDLLQLSNLSPATAALRSSVPRLTQNVPPASWPNLLPPRQSLARIAISSSLPLKVLCRRLPTASWRVRSWQSDPPLEELPPESWPSSVPPPTPSVPRCRPVPS